VSGCSLSFSFGLILFSLVLSDAHDAFTFLLSPTRALSCRSLVLHYECACFLGFVLCFYWSFRDTPSLEETLLSVYFLIGLSLPLSPLRLQRRFPPFFSGPFSLCTAMWTRAFPLYSCCWSTVYNCARGFSLHQFALFYSEYPCLFVLFCPGAIYRFLAVLFSTTVSFLCLYVTAFLARPEDRLELILSVSRKCGGSQVYSGLLVFIGFFVLLLRRQPPCRSSIFRVSSCVGSSVSKVGAGPFTLFVPDWNPPGLSIPREEKSFPILFGFCFSATSPFYSPT